MEDRMNTRKVSFVERLAEQFSANADARSVYGTPIEQGQTIIVPVARVRYGLGGGEGSGPNGEGGAGGGGGIAVSPVGYVELRDGKTRYRRIGGMLAISAAFAAGGIVGALVSDRLRRRCRSTEAG